MTGFLRNPIAVLLILGLVLGLPGSGTGLAQSQAPGQPTGPDDVTNPTTVLYQGYITVGGSPYTGTGYFKFIVTNAAGNTTYWSNNGSSSNGSQPSAAVALTVSEGYFTVLLGDTTLSGMTRALTADVFAGAGRYLKVWFSTTSSGTYTALSLTPVAAAPYALNAETLDGIDAVSLQLRVSGTCAAGNAIRAINANGAVTCEPLASPSHTHWGAAWSGSGNGLTLTSSNGTAFLGRSVAASGLGSVGQAIWGDSNNNVGVFGSSVNDFGVYGLSANATGIYGASTGGENAFHGVYGYSNSTDQYRAGVVGYSPAQANCVKCNSLNGWGMKAYSGESQGVYGESGNSNYGPSGGYFVGPRGAYAIGNVNNSEGVLADCNQGDGCYAFWGRAQDGYGLVAQSTNGSAIYADAHIGGGNPSNYGLYTPDNIWASNFHSAAGLAMAARNGGSQPLRVGDVVVVTGIGEPAPGNSTPLMQVRLADAASAGQVVGVVQGVIRIELITKPSISYKPVKPSPSQEEELVGTTWVEELGETQTPVVVTLAGPAGPGDLVILQMQGLAQVRVSASAGVIHVGDLLTAGPGGLAQRAEPSLALDGNGEAYLAGTILGKALEAWEGGEGLIWVLIDLR